MRTKYFDFEDFARAEYTPGLEGQVATQLMFIYGKAREKDRPVILELGTDKGQSTTVFLEACQERDGQLVSVDLSNCSDVSDSERWHFVQSDSTDVARILECAPVLERGIDVLYIDSLHLREHVEAELMAWYPHMNAGSWIFLDDVDANPYRRGRRKDHYASEILWDEIYEFVKAFFYANEESTYLNILYGSTGLACLHKLSPKGTPPNPAGRTVHRGRTFAHVIKNDPRLLLLKMKRRLLG
jgi:predicted O-methyltransferase YrrM